MKKFSWIVALLIALSMTMALVGCGSEPVSDLVDEPSIGLLVTGRVNDWDSMDIDITSDGLNFDIANKEYVVTVVAKIAANAKVKMAQPDTSYGTIISLPATKDTLFELKETITATHLAGQKKIRLVQTEDSGTTADIFIKSVDVTEDGKSIFTLEKWLEDYDEGDELEDGKDLLPLVFAGNPTIKVAKK